MTFTVEHIEVLIGRCKVAYTDHKERDATLRDAEIALRYYAAMKRREDGEVVGVLCVVTDEDSQYGISAHFSYSDNIAGLAPGDYECYTSPPSQPSTGVPVYGIDYGRTGEDKTCEVHGTRNLDGSITIDSIIYKAAEPRSP